MLEMLPGRLTQDCAENLFSIIRRNNPKPNALQVIHSIKNVCISESLSKPSVNNTSYDYDDGEYLQDFFKILKTLKQERELEKLKFGKKDSSQLKNVAMDISKMHLNKREKNVLCKMACYILYKISVSEIKNFDD